MNDEAEIADLTIDASGVEGEVTLTTDFAAQVATAENATITVNGASYTAAEGALTIDATEDASTLFNGTVALADGEEVTATNGDAITAAAEITVTVTEGEGTTVGGLDEGESFTYSDTAYTMTAIGLIKEGALLTGAEVEDGSIAVENLGEDENWTAIIATENDNLMINDSVLADDVESALVVDSLTSPTVIYGTLARTEDGYALSNEGATAEDHAGTITVDGVKVEFTNDFVSAALVSGDASFAVSAAEDSFTVDATEDTAKVEGATAVTLESGTIAVDEGIEVTAGDTVVGSIPGGYTISNDGGVTVSNVAAEDATFEITGTATVEVNAISESTTYTVGDQTFTVVSDADDKPLTFTITDNVVTAVTGLDEDATLVVTNNAAEDYQVSVNNHSTPFTAIAGGRKSILGIDDGNDATDLDTNSFYAVFDGENITVYGLTIAEDGTKTIGAEIPAEEVPESFGTLENGVITLKAGLVPTNESVIVVSNESTDVEIELHSNSEKIYLSNLSGLGVQIIDTTITVIAVEDDTIVDATEVPSAGRVTIPQNYTLQMTADFAMSATAENGTIEFGDAITLTGNGIEITGATDQTFALATAEATYTINDVAYTAATAEDTVALGDEITVTTTGEGMTISGEGTFVLTAGGTYALNETSYIVNEDATIADNVLTNGTVQVNAESVAVAGDKEVVMSGETDGVIITVADGEVTSISDLEDGVTVEYDGSTYKMIGEKLNVTDADGNTKIYDGNEETNILDLGDLPVVDYEDVDPETNVIDLAKGIEELADGSDSVEYGYGEDSDTAATLTGNADDGYTLSSDAGLITDPEPTLALGEDDTKLDTDFDATVTTPEGDGTYEVNGDTFKADDSALEIETTPEGSTLTNGTVALDGAADNAGVTSTGAEGEDGDTITASDGTQISATVADGELTGVSGIDSGEAFTVGDDTYEKTDVGILKTDADGNTTLLPNSEEADSLDLTDTDTTWEEVGVVNPDGTLDLANVDTDSAFLTADKNAVAANVVFEEPNNYNVTAGDGLASDTKLALGEDDANVTTDFDTTVETPEGDGTYNVNGDTFKADDSALEIATTPDGSTLTNGTVALDGSDEATDGLTTTDGDEIIAAEGTEITATADDGNLASVGGLDDGESFTVGDDTYEKTPVGILKTDADGNTTLLPNSEDADSLDLTDTDTAWNDVAILDSDADTVDLADITGDTTLINPERTEIAATVDYTEPTEDTPATYDVTAGEGLSSDTKLALGEDDANVTTDFDTTVETPENGSGTYNVNGDTFKADDSALEIATTPDGSTLTNGTVALDGAEDSPTNDVTTTDGDTITAGSDTEIAATVEDGNFGESFTVGDDTYEKTPVGILKTDENGDVTMLPDSEDASSLDLTDADTAWTPVEVLDSDGTVDLAGVASDSILLNADKDAIAATVAYTEGEPATYDIASGTGLAEDPTVELGAEDANVTTDFDATVTTPEGDGTYNVNGDTFKADDSALEIATTPDGSTLTNGTVALDGAEDSPTNDVTTTDGDTITAGSDTEIAATVEDGNLTRRILHSWR